jgi:hypothetical protein
VGLDRVEHADRLAVGQRHDEVGAVLDQVEDVLRLSGRIGAWHGDQGGTSEADGVGEVDR